MRTERQRFEIWGRSCGILDPKTGIEEKTTSSDSSVNLHGSGSDDGLDELVSVDGFRSLVMEILAAVQEALEDYTRMANKYKISTGSSPKSPKAASQQIDLKAERESLKIIAKTVSEATNFPRKLQFNLLDQKGLEALLADLIRWNDSLDKLLPRRERTLLAQSLPSQVLAQTEAATMLIMTQ
ncbi:MAG: hypothetical protein Q9207_004520 [Kuettlingeria erythrocarpa]